MQHPCLGRSLFLLLTGHNRPVVGLVGRIDPSRQVFFPPGPTVFLLEPLGLCAALFASGVGTGLVGPPRRTRAPHHGRIICLISTTTPPGTQGATSDPTSESSGVRCSRPRPGRLREVSSVLDGKLLLGISPWMVPTPEASHRVALSSVSCLINQPA